MKSVREFTTQIIVVLIALIVITGYILLIRDDSSKNAATNNSENPPIGDTSMPADEEPQGELEEAQLVAVGSYTGDGVATRSFNGDKFVHEVIANLDDPAAGKFYEGWLVGDGFISTGKLVKETEGEWSLVFSDDLDMRNRDEVVITEETVANGLDDMPEAHVLEGSF